MGKITTKGRAKSYIKPDLMEININFICQGANSSAASLFVVEQCDTFLEKLFHVGFRKEDLSIKDVSVEKNDYAEDASKTYSASRIILLRLPYSARIVNVIQDFLSESGGQFEYSVSFCVKDKEKIRSRLLREAAQDARRKAEQITNALSLEIHGIKKVETIPQNFDLETDWLCQEHERLALAETKPHASDELSAAEEEVEQEVVITWLV